jgi:hypothetical protein
MSISVTAPDVNAIVPEGDPEVVSTSLTVIEAPALVGVTVNPVVAFVAATT